jgi:hypothetical protein
VHLTRDNLEGFAVKKKLAIAYGESSRHCSLLRRRGEREDCQSHKEKKAEPFGVHGPQFASAKASCQV